MNLKNLLLKRAYSSDFDDILNDFYIPVLLSSSEYYRLAGFFSSTSLAIAARGISGFIKNGGMMELIVSPRLNKDDLEIIMNSYEKPEKYIEKKMLEELERLENEFVRDHLFALGWMISNKKLEIRVAIANDNEGNLLSYEDIQKRGIFHQKVGILKDSEGDTITFSGSVNETATGWLENIEEFKVFRSWDSSEVEYLSTDVLKFKRYWNNESTRVKIIDIPHAVEQKLIEIAPKNIEDIDLKKWYKKSKRKKIELFQHQNEAVEAWIGNGMKGILEMATGTGKTFTALGCLEKAQDKSRKLAIIISCPYQHLIQQWIREIGKFTTSFHDLIVADTSNSDWRNNVADSLTDVSLGYKNDVIILTTHRTFSSDDFIKILKNNKRNLNIFLIGDEVHGLGAARSQEGLLGDYDIRLGLSATPKRWFDTTGTDVIYNYFGGVVYEFTLKDAINTINPATGETYLTPYRYVPKFVSLISEELEDYRNKTQAIIKGFASAKSDEEKNLFLERLLFSRANIIKSAVNKFQALEEIIAETADGVNRTIIYCSPQQIDRVVKILNQHGIILHRFTMDEGTVPDKKYHGFSEREFLLETFAQGEYQVLVAMKCLDEGVDLPPAKTAILLASSRNRREYIQRIGRVIRRYPGKSEALILDIIVIPTFEELPAELEDVEKKIFDKELSRCEEIAGVALNSAEALKLLYDIKNKLLEG